MKDQRSFDVLITFCIAFYEYPIFENLIGIILEYCKASLEFSVTAMNLFEELFTLYEDDEHLEQIAKNMAMNYFQIVAQECIAIKDGMIDSDVVDLRSRIRPGMNCIASMIDETVYLNILKQIIMSNTQNYPVIECCTFLWEAVSNDIPNELKSITVLRPKLD